jgi:hypothetical protein
MLQLVIATVMAAGLATAEDYPKQVIEVICSGKASSNENVKIIVYGNTDDESKLIMLKADFPGLETSYTTVRQNHYENMDMSFGRHIYLGIQYVSEKDKIKLSVRNDSFHKFLVNGVEPIKISSCDKFVEILPH